MTTRLEACPHCGGSLSFPYGPASTPPPVTSYVPPYPAPVTRAPAPPAGLSAASVPKILLGLGATCLLVASVIFLAVAWSWLGVGGRTAVLVALTGATAYAGQWLSRRGLAVAAEALTAVALGLVVLDLVGGRRAGWLDLPDLDSFVAVVGGTLLVVSLSLSLPTKRLVVPQLTAPVGLGLLVVELATHTGRPQVLATIAVLLFTGLAQLARVSGLRVLPWSAGVGAGYAFLALGGLAVFNAADHPSGRGLWVDGHGVGLLAVAALVLLPWALNPHHDDLRQLVCSLSLSTLTLTAALPVIDEGATAITLAAAAATAGWAVVAAVAPPRWYAVPRVPLLGSLLVLLPVPIVLGTAAATDLLSVAGPFTAHASVRLDPVPTIGEPLLLPLGVAVAVAAALLTVARSRFVVLASAVVLVATIVLTAALYPLPLWIFVAVLGPLGILVSAPSAVLTIVVLGEIVLLTAWLLLRRVTACEVAAGVVLPLALAAFVWTSGFVLDQPDAVTSLVTLVVLGLLAVALPRLEVELAASAAVLVSSTAGIDAAAHQSVALAVHLTVAGAAVTISSLLHRDHRQLGWLGGLLLAAATWVRLLDLGVHAPEAYTLPTAAALILVGLHRLQRDSDADTSSALLPGLGLATVPTLLWALVDPTSPRAVLIGLASLALLLGGSALRWTAPVLVGWACGGLLVLRELAPYAQQTPQWVLIGTAGTVLIATGISWESRVRDLRRAAGYLAHLR